MRHIIKKFLLAVCAVVLFGGALWMIGSARWNWHFNSVLLVMLIISVAGLFISGLFCRRSWLMLAVAEVAALFSFLLITPEASFNHDKWNKECVKIPAVRFFINGKVAIFNIRAYRYQTPENFVQDFKSDIFDVAQLQSMDIAFSHWEPWGDLVAHMLLCFNFADGKQLAVSFEPRVEQGLTGGQFLPGIYRRYGQMMLLSVPEDVFDLRSHYRGEDLYRYRVAADKAVIKKMFLKVVGKAAQLEKNPEFYNSVTDNCITGLLDVLQCDPRLQNSDWRLFINGFYDRYLFEQGFLQHWPGESFYYLKRRSYVVRKPLMQDVKNKN